MKHLTPKGFAKSIVLASSVSLLGMTYSFADVTLNVNEHAKVTSINGNVIKHSLFKPDQRTFTLQPGKHVITAKYDHMFYHSRDEHDYIKSGEVTITVNLDDNQSYDLVWLNEPKRYDDIKDYADNPTLAVTKGSQVISKHTGTTAGANSGGLFSGITGLFGGNAASNKSQQMTTPIPAVSSSAPAHNKPVTTNPANNSTLDNFMQLWLQATPEEREKIREWVAE